MLTRTQTKVLKYLEYRHFLPVVDRSHETLLISGQPVENHIEDVLDMVDVDSDAFARLNALLAAD